MTIIDGVRAWLKTYEGLADGRLSVDFLPEEAKSYSVDTVPTTEIVKRYLDGSSIRQFLFCVSSREFYSDNIAQNVDNQAFYEGLALGLSARASSGNSLILARAERSGQSRSAPPRTRSSSTSMARRGISFNSN